MKNRGLFLITIVISFFLPTYAHAQDLSGLEREILRQNRARAEEAARARAAENEAARVRAEENARAEAKKAAEQRARIEARKLAVERERIRKEQFTADKEALKNSMRGIETAGSTSRFSSGLRGLSSNDGNNSHNKGLKGLSAGEVTKNNSTDLAGPPNSSYKSTRENSSAPLKRAEPASKKVASRSHYTSSSGYAQYVADVEPEPIYFHSTEANFFRIGSPEPQDKSLDDFIDAFEQKVDVWKENGGHEVLAIVGEQITTFARVAVSASSVIGSQIMKLVEIVSDAKDLNNLETNIVNNSIDAYKKAAVTQNPRYVDEALQDIQQKVDQYADKKIGIRNGAKQTTSNLAEAWTRSRMR